MLEYCFSDGVPVFVEDTSLVDVHPASNKIVTMRQANVIVLFNFYSCVRLELLSIKDTMLSD